IFGTLPLIALGLIGARLIDAVMRKRGHLESQAIALGVLAVGGVHSLVDFSLEIPANTFVFLAFLAAGAASTINLKSGCSTIGHRGFFAIDPGRTNPDTRGARPSCRPGPARSNLCHRRHSRLPAPAPPAARADLCRCRQHRG